MGSTQSKSEDNRQETDFIDSHGHVNNNNIMITEVQDTHQQMLLNEKLLYASCALVGFEFIKLILYVFNAFKRKMKLKYAASSGKK